MDKLTDQQVQIALKDLNGWELNDGSIKKTFKTQNFPATMGFVTAVGGFCQKRNHHPDYILMKFKYHFQHTLQAELLKMTWILPQILRKYLFKQRKLRWLLILSLLLILILI